MSEDREAKREKLEAERLERLHRQQLRQARQKQLEAAEKAREEAEIAYNEAIQGLLEIDPDLFNEESDRMANFDELNTENGPKAIESLGQIKVNWDGEDPQYFFQKLETELQIFSIGKQFTKRQALIRCLPDEVAKEFKHLVNLQETEAGDKPYKDLKDALITSYGPRPGAAFYKAMSRVMTGKPSTLLKLLISDICPTNLKGCNHCNSTIWGLFMLQVPMYLKTSLANEVFTEASMQGIMNRADNTWSANQDQNVSAVAAVSAAPTVSSPVTATVVTTNAAEVAAVGGRGGQRGFRGNRYNRGFRGGRGRGGRGGGQQGPDPRGKRHESNPPWNSCTAHWLYAENAWKCQSPLTCPLKDKTTPKQ